MFVECDPVAVVTNGLNVHDDVVDDVDDDDDNSLLREEHTV